MERFAWLVPQASNLTPGLSEWSASGDAARIVRIAATHGPVHATCLPRAVVLWALLRHEGLSPEVKLGVRRGEHRVEAHAWVEVNGCSLDDGELPFIPLRAVSAALDPVNS
jgi:hypothetical protein